FLTGSKEAVAELTAAVGYVYEFDKAYKEYAHPAGLIILTPEGKIARYFYGIGFDQEYRVPGGTTTLRLSLVEASDGKIGSLLDKFILTCYRFDHISGYSLNVLRAVQLGGILTLLAVVTGVTVALVRERRRTRAALAAANGAPVPASPAESDPNAPPGRTA